MTEKCKCKVLQKTSFRYNPDITDLHSTPTRQRLVDIYALLKGIRSQKKLRSIVCEYLHCSGSDVQEFSYTIKTHKWRGLIYKNRNTLHGTIFSLFDNKPFIVRGFPKLKYIQQDNRTKLALYQDVVCEEKLDGTNLGIWLFPYKENIFMGKTRQVERWDKFSVMAKEDRTWKGKFDRTPLSNNVYEACKDGYQIFIELYGCLNQGDFIRYTVPLAYKVIAIIDVKKNDYAFLPRKRIEEICSKFNMPIPRIDFAGKLTPKEVNRMEYELKEQVKLDGNEGYVAKSWDIKTQDTHFFKIKTEDIRELCYKMSRGLIPSKFIKSAIRKSKENLPINAEYSKVLDLTLNNLLEEQTEELVENSFHKIEDLVKISMSPALSELRTEIIEYIIVMKKEGMDIEHKASVLSALHDKLPLVQASLLYRVYMEYILNQVES